MNNIQNSNSEVAENGTKPTAVGSFSPFYVEENFYLELSDLMDDYDIEEDELDDLPDDWSVKIEEATLEKMFKLTEDDVYTGIVDRIELCHEDRFPEDSDRVFEEIKQAIKQSVDINKLNDLIPELYYPNGKKSVITKADLVAWCK